MCTIQYNNTLSRSSSFLNLGFSYKKGRETKRSAAIDGIDVDEWDVEGVKSVFGEMVGGSTDFRRMRSEHLKRRGDEAMQRGQYREAVEAYASALGAVSFREDVHFSVRLLSNKSLALLRCGKARESEMDALRCIELAPAWNKGYWRCAAARTEQRRRLDAARMLVAFVGVTRTKIGSLADTKTDNDELNADYATGMRQLRALIPKLTRTELAEAIVDTLNAFVVEDDTNTRINNNGDMRRNDSDTDQKMPPDSKSHSRHSTASTQSEAHSGLADYAYDSDSDNDSDDDSSSQKGGGYDGLSRSLPASMRVIGCVEVESIGREAQVEAMFRIIKDEHQRPSSQVENVDYDVDYRGTDGPHIRQFCAGLLTYHALLMSLLLVSADTTANATSANALSIDLYCLRAAIHARARSWAQATRDALTAVHVAKGLVRDCKQHEEVRGDPRTQLLLAKAYYHLGLAYAAEKEAEEQDRSKALMSLTLASDIINGVRGEGDGADAGAGWEKECESLLRHVGSQMSGKEVSDAVREVYETTDAIGADNNNALGVGMMSAMEMGISTGDADTTARDGDDAPPCIMRVEVEFIFADASPKDFSSALRNILRESVAALADLPLRRVMIDGVRQHKTDEHGGKELVVNVKATVGNDRGKADTLVDALGNGADVVYVDDEMLRSASTEPRTVPVRIRNARSIDAAPKKEAHGDSNGRSSGGAHAGFDVLPHVQTAPLASQTGDTQEGGNGDDDAEGVDIEERAVKPREPPPAPALALSLPYHCYRLVDVDGHKVEVPNKHPFMMTRVYYNNEQQQKEVYVQVEESLGCAAVSGDISSSSGQRTCICRWHQSASSIHVVVVIEDSLGDATNGHVGFDVKSQIGVTITSGHLKVFNTRRHYHYVNGELERHVIADDSFWTFDDTIHDVSTASAVEGVHGSSSKVILSIYLTKLNLELLNSPHEHGKSWWERLLKHHSKIMFDDYDKDYSDLPEPILSAYNRGSIQDSERGRIENLGKVEREALQEADDARIRARQERLHMLRLIGEQEERERENDAGVANGTGAAKSRERSSRRTCFYKTWVELDRGASKERSGGAAVPQPMPMKDRFGQ